MSDQIRSLSRQLHLGAGLCALMTAVLPVAAMAQSQTASSSSSSAAASAAPATPAKTPPNDKTTTRGDASSDDTTVVTVTAQKPIIEHKIDRDVYDAKQDPLSATGSAADVLNNVPAVTVDADGNPSLRGNSSVQVYVNGKPTAQMSSDNRAATLQNMSADDIDTIEVMPNPPASFGADSGGGIINIVLKRGRRLQPINSINVQVGDEGKGGLHVQAGKAFGKLVLNASGNLRNNTTTRYSDSDRTRLDPATGLPLSETTSNTYRKQQRQNASLNVSADYQIDELQDLSGELSYSSNNNSSTSRNEFVNLNTLQEALGDQAQLNDSDAHSHGMEANLTYDRRGKALGGEDFKMQLRHSQQNSENETDYHTLFHVPVTPDMFRNQANNNDTTLDNFSGDWVHPLNTDGTRQFSTGWDVQHTTTDIYQYFSLSHLAGQPVVEDPSETNQFNVTQTITSAYFIYQTPITSKFMISAGLRAENMHQVLDQVTSNLHYTNDYITWSPSVYTLYKISDAQSLKLQYGHKITRPNASLLNPFLVYSDSQDVSSGNPNLRPSQIDNYELDYNWDTQAFNLGIDPFYKLSRRNIIYGSEFLPGQPNVLLTTNINSGERKDTGLQYNLGANGLLNHTLSVSLTGTWQYSVQDSTDFVTHLPVERKGPSDQAHLMMRLSPGGMGGDQYAIQGNFVGKSVTSEGYRTGYSVWTVSYIHQIIPRKLVLTLNASDFLDSQNVHSVNQTSELYSISDQFDHGASVMLSLRYTFGQPPKRNGDRPHGQFRGRMGGGRDGGGGDGGGDGGYPGGGGGGGGGRGGF